MTITSKTENGSLPSNGHGRKELDSSSIHFTQAKELKKLPEPGSKELCDQNICTDHMVTVRWTAGNGWEVPELKPFGDITMSPAASCLHYATQCFEGLKVYRGFDGKLRLFRPDLNARRLAMSSRRVSLPAFDDKELVELIKALAAVDCPSKNGILKPNREISLTGCRMAAKRQSRRISLHSSSCDRQR
jgi:branched-chain amino acid aminotransferase